MERVSIDSRRNLASLTSLVIRLSARLSIRGDTRAHALLWSPLPANTRAKFIAARSSNDRAPIFFDTEMASAKVDLGLSERRFWTAAILRARELYSGQIKPFLRVRRKRALNRFQRVTSKCPFSASASACQVRYMVIATRDPVCAIACNPPRMRSLPSSALPKLARARPSAIRDMAAN